MRRKTIRSAGGASRTVRDSGTHNTPPTAAVELRVPAQDLLLTEFRHILVLPMLLTLGDLIVIETGIETETCPQVAQVAWAMEAEDPRQTIWQKRSRTTQPDMKPTVLGIQMAILNPANMMAMEEGIDQVPGIQDVKA